MSIEGRWTEKRTTFQRVYDVLVGTQTPEPAATYAERAACSETVARRALDQLAEMGIADRQEGRPVTYSRNNSSFEWNQIETLANDHDTEKLKERLADLITEDERFQEEYGVPAPNAVSTAELTAAEQAQVEDTWDD